MSGTSARVRMYSKLHCYALLWIKSGRCYENKSVFWQDRKLNDVENI